MPSWVVAARAPGSKMAGRKLQRPTTRDGAFLFSMAPPVAFPPHIFKQPWFAPIIWEC
jgi:hypothetical protein